MKTIQEKYTELCYEIEKLPASEQQTKVITMFCQFKKDTDALLVDAVNKYDTELKKANDVIRELIKECKFWRWEDEDISQEDGARFILLMQKLEKYN